MIRDCNRVKRLQWVKETLGDDFSEYIFSNETTFQKVTKGSTALKLEKGCEATHQRRVTTKNFGRLLMNSDIFSILTTQIKFCQKL